MKLLRNTGNERVIDRLRDWLSPGAGLDIISPTISVHAFSAHLRRILQTYARYYNDVRTHRSLDKDAPVSRPVQRTGIISSRPILGGLHHHYVRI